MGFEGENSRQAEKPSRRKLTLNVPLPTHDVMVDLAKDRHEPTTRLMDDAFETFARLDNTVSDHPKACIVLFEGGPRLPLSLFAQLGKDVW